MKLYRTPVLVRPAGKSLIFILDIHFVGKGFGLLFLTVSEFNVNQFN